MHGCWALAVLVDEAHNLVDRARRMYSAELDGAQLLAAVPTAPQAVQGPLLALAEATQDLAADTDAPYAVLDAAPDGFMQTLQTAAGALSEHFHQQPLSVGALLGLHFALQRFLKLADALVLGAKPALVFWFALGLLAAMNKEGLES